MREISSNRCFGGVQKVFEVRSEVLDSTVRFGVYLPPAAGPRPALYWLSGLTCNEQNFITKAGAQRYAAEHGLVIVNPDTSPRGAGLPGETASWDLGEGAGFYVNATQEPWARHYRMFDHVVHELPALVEAYLPVDPDRKGISGHSMGGHGALVAALRSPGRYLSVSAFAPICAPAEVPWGHKAFGAYLGPDRAAWREWDSTALLADAPERLHLLVDQGLDDPFLTGQLQPERLEAAATAAGHPLTLRRHAGYDHSYYFVSTFIGEHISWHAAAMG